MAKPSALDNTNPVLNVANGCPPADTADDSIAVMPVNRPLTVSDKKYEDVTVATGKRDALRNCAFCGEPFLLTNPRRLYCNGTCRSYAYYARHGGRKCMVCGRPTSHPSRSICSDECRRAI